MLNKVTLVGNVGREPELRYLSDGTPVCNFNLATNERWKDRESGEQRERTTWFRVACWNGLAEPMNQYLETGRQVYVEGRVSASAWTDQDGEARATLEVRADTVKFLGKRTGNGAGAEQPPSAPPNGGDIPF